MSRYARLLVSAGLAFVGYRICAEFMELPSAALVGLILGGCTWALTVKRQSDR